MRWLLLLVAGCGFHGPGTAGAPSDAIGLDAARRDAPPTIDGDVPLDAPMITASDAALLPDALVLAPPFALTGARWLLPCSNDGHPNATACSCTVSSQAITIAGVGQWHVSARIRGVMEKMAYVNGAMVGGWYQGGTPGNSADNYYELAIDSTVHYYLNNGTNNGNHSYAFDFTVPFDVSGGSMVTFSANGQDGIQWMGVDQNAAPISVANVTSPAQPYDGQWARIDVITATPF